MSIPTTEATTDQARLAAKINSQYAEIAHWRRAGTVVHVVRESGKVAPAYYQPATGDVTVDLDEVTTRSEADLIAKLADGERIIVTEDRELAKIGGLICHEAAHSAWSGWLNSLRSNRELRPRLTAQVMDTLELFEEIRIEKRAIDNGRANARRLLRASFEIIIESIVKADLTNPHVAAGTWALTAGRVRSGAVLASEVAAVDSAARTLLGDDVVDTLSEVLDEAVEIGVDEIDDEDVDYRDVDVDPYMLERLVTLAEDWLEALPAPTKDEGSGNPTRCSHGMLDEDDATGKPASPAERATEESEDDEGKTAGSSDDDEDEDEDDGASDDEGGDADDDGDDDVDTPRLDESLIGSVPEDYDEDIESEPNLDDDAAAEMLAAIIKSTDAVATAWDAKVPVSLRNSGEYAAAVFGPKKIANGRNWERRPPRPADHQGVKRLANELERMAMPTITKRQVNQAVPPGKLRGREAVRASAERARGQMVSATPWKTTKRKHDHVPPMTIGIMTDTSGSMSWAENLVASAAYVVSHAGHRVGARFAAVTFGNHAEAVVRPGELPAEIRVRSANGGLEAFDDAMAALDGVLHLTDGRPGAKVLIVVTDGHLVRANEMAKARRWVELARKAGTIVVQVAFTHAKPIAPGVELVNLDGVKVDDLVTAIIGGLKRQMVTR